MAISKIPSAGFQDNVKFRNIIINSDMSISQRATSQASITSSGYYTADRWRLGVDTAGTWTQTQSTDVPTAQGFQKSTKLDCTTANASLGTGNILYFEQLFEGQNLQYLKKGTANAESLTASFWVKSNKTGTYIVELIDDNNRHINKSYTINSANTWEKKTITYPGDTTGALDNDNTVGLTLNFWLVAGSDFTSGTLQTSWGSLTNANRAVGQVNLADSTSNEWYVTGVQLEAGQTASEFEFLPTDVNLHRCQRYFYSNEVITNTTFWMDGYQASTGYINRLLVFPVTMRVRPSMSYSGNWTTSNMSTSSASFVAFSTQGFKMEARASSTGRAFIYPNGAGTLTADAEL